jgi:hypothetical protein
MLLMHSASSLCVHAVDAEGPAQVLSQVRPPGPRPVPASPGGAATQP